MRPRQRGIIELPERVGQRTLISSTLIRTTKPNGHSHLKCRVRCDCGNESLVDISAWRKHETKQCRECAGKQNGMRRNAMIAAGLAKPRHYRHKTDRQLDFAALPYEQDSEVQQFVAEHPSGATLNEIAEYLGLTRERVRQIEDKALLKLKHRCPGLAAMLVPDHEPRAKRSTVSWDEVVTYDLRCVEVVR